MVKDKGAGKSEYESLTHSLLIATDQLGGVGARGALSTSNTANASKNQVWNQIAVNHNWFISDFCAMRRMHLCD